MGKYLLIISCSKRKIKYRNPTKAIEVYDGPIYRMLRKMMREGKLPQNLDIVIISAKYGLIMADDEIAYYDEFMTKAKAYALRSMIIEKLNKRLTNKYREIFINLGENYIITIKDFEKNINSGCEIIYARGRLGERLKQTREWLLNLSRSI